MTHPPVNPLTFSMGEIRDYETWLRAQGFSQNTIDQRVRFAERRLSAWGTWQRTPRDLALWLERYGGWTRLTYHNHLTSLYAWVETVEGAPSPMAGIRRGPSPQPRPRPLSPEEVVRVLENAHDERLRLWLLLGLLAGLRSHEIAKIRGVDVGQDSLYVLGKGARADNVPTHPLLWRIAADMPAGHWFPSPQHDRPHISASLVGQQVRAHFRSLDIASGSVHRLRATYGTTLLRNGHNIRVIQGLLRHRSLSSTEHYLGVTEDERVAAIRSLVA